MKKLTYLLSILFVITLMSTSCEKEDTIVPETGITVEDLLGDWNFSSLEYNGVTYTDCDPALAASYAIVDLSLLDVTTTTLAIYTSCGIYGGTDDLEHGEYSLNENILMVGDHTFVYEIQNVDTFDGSTLVLKWIDASAPSIMPIGAVYILEHSN